MGNHPEVLLLGGVTLKLNGSPPPGLTSRKAVALFVYLICHPGQPFSRDLLANLFYGHLPQPRAAADLRVLLSRLRPLSQYLRVTRHDVAFDPNHPYWLDTLAMEEGLAALAAQTTSRAALSPQAAEGLETALALYRGDFLAGFHVPDALVFEEWAVVERERLGRLALEGLERLVSHYSVTGEFGAGLKAVTRLLELDSLHEAGHRHMMRMLARSGQPNQALAHYRTCCQVFADELEAEPSSETKVLYGRIRDMAKGPAHNLPSWSTSFVGRKEELAWIAQRLQTPGCRLLTLVGPGGIGKTRLAIEAARGQVDQFWGGVRFVSLVEVDSIQQVISAMATALNLTFQGPEDPKTQLLRRLRNKSVLLVLDTFEHLVTPPLSLQEGATKRRGGSHRPLKGRQRGGSAAQLLADILQAAPRVKLLVTSRQRLNLSGEWAMPVGGLPLPASAEAEHLARSGAAQLLVERGRQVRPGFRLSAADRPAALRLCRLVGGMPLAIELAAGWLKLVSPAAIAREIERDLDVLAASYYDVPERQRDIRAVFEYSWGLLSETERRGARALAVFRGGFRRQAAEAVLGEKEKGAGGQVLRLLSGLVDKALLVATPTGRYTQHPLVRQFAGEKLAAWPEELAQARERHGRYYAAFLEQRRTDLEGPRQMEAFAEIVEELENIRTAWHWANDGGRVAEIGMSLECLFLYFTTRNRYREAQAFFGQALDTVQQVSERASEPAALGSDQVTKAVPDRETTAVLSRALVCQAMCMVHLGALEQAGVEGVKDLVVRSLDLARSTGEYKTIVVALDTLGLVALAQGQVKQARTYVEEALRLARAKGDAWLCAMSLSYLGGCARREDYAEAAAYYRESVAICQDRGDLRGYMASLFQLGEMTRLCGQLAEAKSIFDEGLVISRELDNLIARVWFLAGLTELAFASGDYRQAGDYLQECLTIAEEDDNYWGPVPDLTRIGNPAEAIRNCPAAQEYFNESVRLALDLHFQTQVLEPLVRLAELLVGNSGRA